MKLLSVIPQNVNSVLLVQAGKEFIFYEADGILEIRLFSPNIALKFPGFLGVFFWAGVGGVI